MKFNFLLHLHPKRIYPAAFRFNLTYGLGGIAALSILVQIITGLLLKLHYQPNPAQAYDSILLIQQEYTFGQFIRNLHHWSSVLLIWVVFLHLLRVVFTGAFYKPRDITWIFGLLLFILTVMLNFTGYLLPWDQLSYWAVTIATSLIEYIPIAGIYLRENLIGGQSLNALTLSNFYHLHTGFLPAVLIVLMSWHFWKIRKAGGVILNKEQKEQAAMVETTPHLIAREVVVALAVLAILLILSVFFDAPLKERANPYESLNPAKAPWYFMGFQEMLIHIHPMVAIAIFPLLIFGLALKMPYTSLKEAKVGVWFSSAEGKKMAKATTLVSTIFIIFVILLNHFLGSWLIENIPWPGIILQGFLPLIITIALIYFLQTHYRKKYNSSSLEQIQNIVLFFAVCYILLSITGLFFRGEGMELCWPWNL